MIVIFVHFVQAVLQDSVHEAVVGKVLMYDESWISKHMLHPVLYVFDYPIVVSGKASTSLAAPSNYT
jgi:hypothetical protein